MNLGADINRAPGGASSSKSSSKEASHIEKPYCNRPHKICLFNERSDPSRTGYLSQLSRKTKLTADRKYQETSSVIGLSPHESAPPPQELEKEKWKRFGSNLKRASGTGSLTDWSKWKPSLALRRENCEHSELINHAYSSTYV